MSSSERFPLSVRVSTAQGGRPEDSCITVLDGRDEPLKDGRGNLRTTLPAGLYTVRVERAGARSERVVRHAAATKLRIDEPQRYSAVPTADTASSREYYTEPAETWSRSATAPPIGPDALGSLFLFLRAPSQELASPPPVRGELRLLDYDGGELCQLDVQRVRYDSIGWLAFHAAIPPGEYVLAYAGDLSTPARELALAVFRGWQTQVFATYVRAPLFASASVLMSRGGFVPHDRTARVVDAALAGLQNGRSALPPGETNMLLYKKFDNPMLGLVGAHVLLQEERPDPQRFARILANLRSVLGDAADVRALELIAAERLGLSYDVRPFERPPMLRRGLDAVLQAAAGTRPALVPPGSLLDAVAPRAFVDCPWSSWEPVLGIAAAQSASSDWVLSYVRDAVVSASRRGTEFEAHRTAEKAALPVATIRRAYEEIRETMPPGEARTLEQERLVAQTRAGAGESDRTAAQVREQFLGGGEGERIEALALMQGNERLRDFGVALDGISRSRSAFEQYHALRLANAMVPALDSEQRRELEAAIRAQREEAGHIKRGRDRWYLAERILSQLESR